MKNKSDFKPSEKVKRLLTLSKCFAVLAVLVSVVFIAFLIISGNKILMALYATVFILNYAQLRTAKSAAETYSKEMVDETLGPLFAKLLKTKENDGNKDEHNS